MSELVDLTTLPIGTRFIMRGSSTIRGYECVIVGKAGSYAIVKCDKCPYYGRDTGFYHITAREIELLSKVHTIQKRLLES